MAVQQQTTPVTNQSVGNVAQTPKQPVAIQTSQTSEQLGEMTTQPESIFMKWWFWVVVAIIVLGGVYFLFFK